MVELGRVSRSGFYRFAEEPAARADSDSKMELRDAIQRIALEWPAYGRPRITAELRRRGWKVNPKRVRRILARRQPATGAQTKDRRHHRFPSQPKGLSEPGAGDVADRLGSVVDRRYHLHPTAGGVCVFGGDLGRVLAPD